MNPLTAWFVCFCVYVVCVIAFVKGSLDGDDDVVE